jgi:hypothetical protein
MYVLTIYGKPYGDAAPEHVISSQLERLKWSLLGVGMEQVS